MSVIGIKRGPHFDTPAGIEAIGPRHWGFDVNFAPIERLVGSDRLVDASKRISFDPTTAQGAASRRAGAGVAPARTPPAHNAARRSAGPSD